MIADLWLLLTLRWQIAWNRFVRRRAIAKIGLVSAGVGIALGGGATFGSLAFGVGAVLRRAPDPVLEALVPGLILTSVTGLLLLTSIGSQLGPLCFTDDLDLLMAAPVDRRAVFISKVIDGMATTTFLVVTLAGSALTAYGVALGYGPLYYLLALIAVVGTPLLPAGLGAVAVMIVARYAPIRRVREVLGLTAGLIGIFCSLLAQTSRIWTQQFGRETSEPSLLMMRLRDVAALPIPSFVAGRGLARAGAGDAAGAVVELAGFWLLTFGLFAGSVLLASRLYEAGWVRMKSGGAARRGRERAAREAGRSSLLGRAPVALAIALKDWRLVTRDLRNFASFLWPVVLLPVIFFNLIGGGRRGTLPLDTLTRFTAGTIDPAPVLVAGSILAVATLFVSRLASTSISIEGRSWWLMKSAPLSAAELLTGKLVAALAPFVAISTLAFLIAAIVQGYSLLGALYGWYGIQVLGAGSLAISVGLSVPWSRLDWDTPRQMSSGWGSLVALILQILLFALAGLLLLAPLVAEVFVPSFVAGAFLVGSAGAAGVTAAIAVPVFRFGVRWLPKVGEA
ncbi:MAG: hypothetical protein KatS3mg060_2040 [Dehalococcoidia bacterium]|nr:MAG: hypothetical protein KatS3mg060_2040 [Dehalococcoidia bacterium]